jgi:hypothetical protein
MASNLKTKILTDNEARVALSILSGGLESEEDRMRSSGIPRTTYRTAKRRLYSEGILEDRFVPNPCEIGIPRVSFLLTRPSVEKAGYVVESLAKVPGTVELWSGTQIVFAVIFHDSVTASESFQRKAINGDFGNVLSLIQIVTAEHPTPLSRVPVYFDFEGAWIRYCGSAATRSYPCPLPFPHNGSGSREDSQKAVPSSIASLLTRHFSRPSHLIGPSSMPRSQMKSLRLGKVEWRVFLSLSHLNTLKYRGMTFQDVVFIAGKLRKPGGLSEFFPDLVNCNVRPFLLASDDNSVLMANLGIGLGAVDYVPIDAQPRQSVIQTIARHVKDIELIREPLAPLRMPVAHQYDRLVR